MNNGDAIADKAQEAGEAAKAGRVAEFRRILNELDREAASSLPTDIGWGRHTPYKTLEERKKEAEDCAARNKTLADKDREECVDPGATPPERADQEDSDYFLGIYAGLEGTTLQNVNSEEATARVGVTLYNQLLRFRGLGGGANGETEGNRKSLGEIFSREECRETSTCGAGLGLHAYLSLLLTSSAEQSVLAEDDTPAAPVVVGGDDMMTDMLAPTVGSEEPEDASVQSSIELELGTFAPLYKKHRTKYGELLAGPIAYTSVSSFDGSDSFVKRYYGGVRVAYSPESWIDLTYGKTEGLDGRRAEIRFQVPVFNISPDSRLLVGAIANIGVRNTDDDDLDSFRLFVSWNTGFRNLFSSN